MISFTYVSIISQSLSNMYVTHLGLKVFELRSLTYVISLHLRKITKLA